MTEEERAMRAHEGMLFDKELGSFGEGYSHEQSDSQYSFGNPALQQGTDAHPVLDTVNTQAPTAWDSIRKANGPPENAWNKVRKQSTSQQQQPQQQSSPSQQSASSQLAGAWSKAGQHDHNEGSSLDSSADWAPGAPALKSDEFPRSREDFEEASRTTTTKYGDSVYS
ncbi:hypothetical protein GGI04_002538 [Coemansia thaxteri]|nr:hypothetical protein GGI04_002538 [Coemansia thaxteri]